MLIFVADVRIKRKDKAKQQNPKLKKGKGFLDVTSYVHHIR